MLKKEKNKNRKRIAYFLGPYPSNDAEAKTDDDERECRMLSHTKCNYGWGKCNTTNEKKGGKASRHWGKAAVQ